MNSADIYAFAAAVIEAKDPYTQAHTHRVAESAQRVGRRLGLAGSELDTLYRGAILHDVGKIGVPDDILLKPGPLDPEEQASMHRHCVIGENMVAPLRSCAELLPIIRHHHERYDGTGYPDHLAGQEIPLAARILSVCDAYDALVTDRPYRPGLTPDEAVTILCDGAGRQWDPEVVEAFLGAQSVLDRHSSPSLAAGMSQS